tara:strand:- start:733 stop:1041 length:309 start_codon:yes stop_codon:yes gene_type:complete
MAKNKQPKYSLGFEILNSFAAAIMIVAMVWLLANSITYWRINYPRALDLPSQAFYISVGVVIVTVLAQWVEGRGKALIRSLELINENRRLKNGRRKQKRNKD